MKDWIKKNREFVELTAMGLFYITVYLVASVLIHSRMFGMTPMEWVALYY